jgi:hypothetical protein
MHNITEQPIPNIRIYLERIARLVNVLRGVNPTYFDITKWVDIDKKTFNQKRTQYILTEIVEQCKSTACAAGHAALQPWFVERGFVYNPNGCVQFKDEDHNTHYGFWALCEFFGFTHKECDSIFFASGYKNVTKVEPTMVIDAIRVLRGEAFSERYNIPT